MTDSTNAILLFKMCLSLTHDYLDLCFFRGLDRRDVIINKSLSNLFDYGRFDLK